MDINLHLRPQIPKPENIGKLTTGIYQKTFVLEANSLHRCRTR